MNVADRGRADTTLQIHPLQLPPDAESARAARRYVRACLDVLGRPDLIECAVLGVDELVANVCRHAHTPLIVAVGQANGGRVRIEVSDNSPVIPVRREADNYGVNGRGLTLLDACGLWGLSPTPPADGKTIWFEPFADLAS